MLFKKLFPGLILFLLIAFLAVDFVQAEELFVEINLPEEAYVETGTIILGEIGEITGPAELVKKVAAVNAGTAPVAGSSRRLTKGQIEVRLRQAGLDPALVKFTGLQTVQVYRVVKERQEQSPYTNLQTGPTTYKVVVAARDVTRGEILSATDLAWEERELRPDQVDGRSIAEFSGLRATRFLSAGTVLNSLNVEVPPAIERGDKVTIMVQTGSIMVTAPGVAREKGGIGQVIAVENSLSRQVVQAVIIDSETVQVKIGGAVAP